jgi:hypothetical protein
MGMRQPARTEPRPVYGLPEVAFAEERYDDSRGLSMIIPFLVLFVALGVATMWLVAKPALERKPQAEPTCEVFVLKTGTVKCVPIGQLTTTAATKGTKPKAATPS